MTVLGFGARSAHGPTLHKCGSAGTVATRGDRAEGWGRGQRAGDIPQPVMELRSRAVLEVPCSTCEHPGIGSAGNVNAGMWGREIRGSFATRLVVSLGAFAACLNARCVFLLCIIFPFVSSSPALQRLPSISSSLAAAINALLHVF